MWEKSQTWIGQNGMRRGYVRVFFRQALALFARIYDKLDLLAYILEFFFDYEKMKKIKEKYLEIMWALFRSHKWIRLLPPEKSIWMEGPGLRNQSYLNVEVDFANKRITTKWERKVAVSWETENCWCDKQIYDSLEYYFIKRYIFHLFVLIQCSSDWWQIKRELWWRGMCVYICLFAIVIKILSYLNLLLICTINTLINKRLERMLEI